jgi:hypothetical protein
MTLSAATTPNSIIAGMIDFIFRFLGDASFTILFFKITFLTNQTKRSSQIIIVFISNNPLLLPSAEASHRDRRCSNP